MPFAKLVGPLERLLGLWMHLGFSLALCSLFWILPAVIFLIINIYIKDCLGKK